MLKICSWNINSVRLRINLLKESLEKYNPDIICLQETKTEDKTFPLEAIKSLGYPFIAFTGEKSYNGVAIISKLPFKKEFSWDMCEKGDKRHIAIELNEGLIVHNFYIPAGGDEADININPKFKHKLNFVDEIRTRFLEQKKIENTVILGDFNIAPFENDVWSHKQLLKVVSHTPVEVEKLQRLQQECNFIDTHRYFTKHEEKLYSWWSYRARNWQESNKGRRLDHIWASNDLEKKLLKTDIYKETRGYERPSDHAIISLEIES